MTEDKKAFILKMAVEENGEWNSDCEYAGEYFRSAWQDNLQQTCNYEKGQMIYIDVPPKSPTCSYVVKCTRTEYEDFIESLFKDAPEDAECYVISNKIKEMEGWIKFDAGKAYYCMIGDSEWTRGGDLVDEGRLIPRPSKKIKDLGDVTDTNVGEWVPEVGQECEFSFGGGEFSKCLVMGYFGDLVWISHHHYDEAGLFSGSHQTHVTRNLSFRPLKTEAEKERERLAAELFSDATDSDMSIEDAKTTALFNDCLRAIDRGWHK